MAFLYSVLILTIFASCSRENYQKLVEAESFGIKGGWVVDPQFVEQMGSPYLLAHGLGKPVGNAGTEFSLPSKGRYNIWVRTKNWAPGNWEAPGRFLLVINGIELSTILGTVDGWNWQYAGALNFRDDTVNLELKDLTGFDGRCDAIFFSTGNEMPPSEGKELNRWRREVSGESDVPLKIGVVRPGRRRRRNCRLCSINSCCRTGIKGCAGS